MQSERQKSTIKTSNRNGYLNRVVGILGYRGVGILGYRDQKMHTVNLRMYALQITTTPGTGMSLLSNACRSSWSVDV